MTKRQVLAALGALVGAGLLAWLLRHVDWAELRRAGAAVPVWTWTVCIAGLLASYALRALRLRTEWQPRVGATFGECLHLMLVHNAAVNLLPFRAGEAGYPWLLHRRWGVPVAQAAASLLKLRLQDAAVLGWLAVLCLAPLGRLALIAVAVLGLAGFVAGGALRRGRRLAWGCAIANWPVKLLAIGLLLSTLAGLPVTGGVRGAAGGEVASVLPLQGPAGLGTYEAAVWASVALFHRETMGRVAGAALVVHFFNLCVGLLAAAAVSLTGGGAPRRARTDTSTDTASP